MDEATASPTISPLRGVGEGRWQARRARGGANPAASASCLTVHGSRWGPADVATARARRDGATEA